MNWKIGQKLVFIPKPGFYQDPVYKLIPNATYTYDGDGPMGGDMYLEEFNSFDPKFFSDRIAWWKHLFVPVNPISAKSELIEKFVEVEEKSDCPIQVPETV